MNYKIYDKVICVVDCESMPAKYSQKVKSGEIFTVYGYTEGAITKTTPSYLSLSKDNTNSRLLVRSENFIPLSYWREDQINKLLNEK